MAQQRFKEQGNESFFGSLVYDRIVPEGHFFRRLNAIIPWERFTRQLVKYYRGRAREGRPPYDPAVLLKMLLVSYLYDLSERQVEEMARFNLPVKYFLGLGADELPPDHSTLTAFKRRLLENGKLDPFEELLVEIVNLASEQGIEFGTLQVIDSVHTVADVNVEKDDKRRRDGKPPRDPGAQWGVKHSRLVKDGEGKSTRQKVYFYGYKGHVSLNAQTGLITSAMVTPGNAHDGRQFPGVLERDLALGLPVEIVAADRAYDDTRNHYMLKVRGVRSAIRLNDYRTQKKDKSKAGWVAMKANPEYTRGQRERYKIERKFGEAKQGHGLGRCRYVGFVRYAIQLYLTAVALNLKRMVKLLTGVNFKGRARATV
ncbi:MAG TPA: IS5 family transposase [Anaerolineae bacterium]|jgi:IS5 family transposase|nr:IS5 family transposase [Anaerolineae bacterium]